MHKGITRWIFSTYRIIAAIGEHIVPKQPLACRSKCVRIEESTQVGGVVAGLQVIELSRLVVDIATVAEGVESADGSGVGSGNRKDVAPGVVGVLRLDHTANGHDGSHITLEVGSVEIPGTVVNEEHGLAVAIVEEVEDLVVYFHRGKLAAVVGVLVGIVPVGGFRPQAVSIVSILPGLRNDGNFSGVGGHGIAVAVGNDTAVHIAVSGFRQFKAGNGLGVVPGGRGIAPAFAAVGADLPAVGG